MPGSKGGKARSIYLPYRMELARIIYQYSTGVFPDMFLFFNYRSDCKRYIKDRDYVEVSHKLRYHFNKWFEGVIEGSIPPYFLRHNRFSKLAERGVSMEQIRITKGSKSMASVDPYVHLSTKTAKEIARKVD